MFELANLTPLFVCKGPFVSELKRYKGLIFYSVIDLISLVTVANSDKLYQSQIESSAAGVADLSVKY